MLLEVLSMGRTSTAVKNRYNMKAYDRLAITVPKGQKQAVEAFAKGRGESVNGMLNRLVRAEMGLSEDEWKHSPNAETIAAMMEAERITYDPNAKRYTDLDELFADLNA